MFGFGHDYITFRPSKTPEGLNIVELSQCIPHLRQYTIYILENASDKIKEAIRGGISKKCDIEESAEEELSTRAEGFHKWFDQYKKEHSDLSSDYNCLILDQPLTFEISIPLTQYINKVGGGNIIAQSCLPDTPKFIMVEATEENLWEKIAAIIEYVEKEYRNFLFYDVPNRIKNSDFRIIKKIWDYARNNETIKKYAPLDEIPEESRMLHEGVIYCKGLNERFGIEPNDSKFKIRKKLLAKLDQLVALANKVPEANRELVKLLNEIPADYLAFIMKGLKPAQLVKASYALDPENLSLESQLRIEFLEKETCEGINKNKLLKNDGKYLLFLRKGEKQVQVRFSHKYSFIVYLLYAIDRYKKGNKIEPLELGKLKDEYIRLYRLVYPHDYKYQTSYEQLLENKDSDESTKRTKLDNCLSEIRLNITEACEELKEECPTIHFIPNTEEHIYTRSSNIQIPYVLL